MNPEMRAKVERIQKVSRSVATVCRICFGIMIVAFVVMAFAIVSGHQYEKMSLSGVTIPANKLSTGSKMALTLWLIPVTAVALRFVYLLNRLFRNYAEGKIFTVEPVAHIRQLGLTMLLAAAIEILHFPIATFVIKDSELQGETICFSLPPTPLIVGGLVILISWIMDVGRPLREENELTI